MSSTILGMRRYCLIGLLSLLTTLCFGQQLVYDVDFVTDFDSRESYHPYEQSGTIFGIRLTPTIGVGFNDSIGGDHRLMAGVSYVQPFGADWKHCRVLPTIHYRYEMKGFRVHFGFVPYTELFDPLPDYLRSDSVAFAYPNIQGALFQYRSRWGHVEALCDWRGMMSDTVREAFRLVIGGRFEYRWFYAGGYAQMNHLSHSEKVLGVCDDVVANPLVGVNLSAITPLDSFSIQTGYLMGWQRDRRANQSTIAHGFHADLALRWRFIGLRNELYVGQNQMPLYPRYASMLNQGDPRYQAKLYNRTDFYLYLVRLPFATAYAGWNLIYIDGYGLSHQQQVVCRFNLEQLMLFTKLDKQQRKQEWKRGAILHTLTYR